MLKSYLGWLGKLASMEKSKRMGQMLLVLTVVGLTLITASVFYRWHKGKPIFQPKFAEIDFKETWCSGQSDRRFNSRLTQAPGILWVVIAKNRLHVSPHFPFNLALASEVLGWDHDLPGESILDVRIVQSGAGTETVQLRYRHLTGDEENLQLVIPDRAAFLAALAQIRGK